MRTTIKQQQDNRFNLQTETGDVLLEGETFTICENVQRELQNPTGDNSECAEVADAIKRQRK